MSKLTKIAVTGAAGFIGSNICDELLSHGSYEIIAIDDLSTGRVQNVPIANGEKLQFHRTTILDLDSMKQLFKDVEYVIHQAAIPSVPKSIEDPIGTTNANIMGTLNVLVAAKECKVKRVVLASSSSVYGNNPILPQVESMETGPISPYATSKLVNELHAKQFYDLYSLETVALRYFNVFGPKQNPKSEYAAVIPKFIAKITNGESPTIFGDGSATRDFSYVKDVVGANLLALKAPKAACGKAFNISGGKPIRIDQLVETLNKLMGKKIKPKYEKERKGDIKHSYADMSLAKKYLGHNPKYSLESGLIETIKWFEKHE
ncbi:MAG: SDR family oxidoreductase [Candidatus Micrarchaeota archaeon]|nr:SDR family oxidoreductase [Candidatus Micrarchaeota archaeon]